MIGIVLVVVPLVVGLVVVLRPRAALPLLAFAGVACTAVAIFLSASSPGVVAGAVRIDSTTKLFAPVVNVVFLGIAVYVWTRATTDAAFEAMLPTRRFTRLALPFLAACNLVLVGNHLLVLWLALEASTLAAAPLIVRPGSAASRLASWRYLLFSSVGLGLTLTGFACLARSQEADGHLVTMYLDQLPAAVAGPANAWRDLGVGLTVLGVGTKLGLAPMYTWLPEAYDEAPSAVTALLGAVQFNCALVLLFRIVTVYRPGSDALITGELLVIGVASIIVSTVSIIATRNFKRLLAYAAINHAGVIAIGLSIGRGAGYAVLLYAVSNAFIKGILFLTAGKIEAHCGTKDTREIGGLIKDLPYSGVFLMVGTFALLGFPPFGSFLGELLILSALVGKDQLLVFAGICLLATMSFVATGRTVFPMIWGEPKVAHPGSGQSPLAVAPKLVFFVALVVLGIYIPSTVNGLFAQVAQTLEGP